MYDKILNNDYYHLLLNSFKDSDLNHSLLPISQFNRINLSFIKKAISKKNGFDIIIKFPKHYDSMLDEFYANLYLYIANFQFNENYINTNFEVGELLVRKIGKKNRRYKVVEIKKQQFILLEQKKESLKDFNGPATLYVDRENIIKEFVPIKRPLKKESLNNFLELFSSLNKLDKNKDYFPTKFDSITVLVGSKRIFDNFRNTSILEANLYNSIPCYYLTRDGKDSDTLGIEPLLYFVPSYNIAYQYIIQNKIQVSNIVLLNDGFDELQQIISDQSIYCFRILGICTTPIEEKLNNIKYWEWHKEEINLIKSL
ncbi:MAG: hypothetical protein N2321_02760 [Melioribacteraceae bacterium]|nr:hypothetical protein [Melioribacteraceae bacterium]